MSSDSTLAYTLVFEFDTKQTFEQCQAMEEATVAKLVPFLEEDETYIDCTAQFMECEVSALATFAVLMKMEFRFSAEKTSEERVAIRARVEAAAQEVRATVKPDS